MKVKITSTPPQPNAEPAVKTYEFEVPVVLDCRQGSGNSAHRFLSSDGLSHYQEGWFDKQTCPSKIRGSEGNLALFRLWIPCPIQRHFYFLFNSAIHFSFISSHSSLHEQSCPSAKFVGFIAQANADRPYHLAHGDLRSQIEVTHVETGQRWVV